MSLSTVRVGVVGAGAIGVPHMEALRSHPKARLVAVADTSPTRCKAAADRFNLKPYADHHALLAAREVDAVTIALPNGLHRPVAEDAFAAGVHVLTDKPFSTSHANAMAMVEAAKKAGKTLAVGMNQRYSPAAHTARRLIAAGKIGHVYHVRAAWLRRCGTPKQGTWFTQKKLSGGGCLYDIGVHALDRALYILGDFSVRSAMGFVHSQFGPRGLGEGGWGQSERDPKAVFDVDDYAGALLHLAGGRTLMLEASWARHQLTRDEQPAEYYGTEGLLEVNERGLTLHAPSGSMKTYSHTELAAAAEPGEYTERMHDWIDALLEGRPTLVKLEEALAVQKTLDAIYASAASGQSVSL